MSVFHRALDRTTDWLWTGRNVTMHFTADYQIARMTLPLIKRLIADDEDGETYRCSIAQWIINDQPRQCREIDRAESDGEARAVIARWVADTFAEPHTGTVPDGSADDPSHDGPGDPAPALCALCKKGLGHA